MALLFFLCNVFASSKYVAEHADISIEVKVDGTIAASSDQFADAPELCTKDNCDSCISLNYRPDKTNAADEERMKRDAAHQATGTMDFDGMQVYIQRGDGKCECVDQKDYPAKVKVLVYKDECGKDDPATKKNLWDKRTSFSKVKYPFRRAIHGTRAAIQRGIHAVNARRAAARKAREDPPCTYTGELRRLC